MWRCANPPLGWIAVDPSALDRDAKVWLMDGSIEQWHRERRALPAELEPEAARNLGGSIAEIDGEQVSDPNGYVPAEAIIGVFVIGADGRATGEYVRNPNHGLVCDDLTKLESPEVWLGWLADSPAAAVREEIAKTLNSQVSGSTLEWLKVIDEPVHLAGGRRSPDDSHLVMLVRAAIAVPLALGVRPPDGAISILTGVFSWAAARLDTAERMDRIWLDFGMGREEAETLLQQRIYELDAPV
jgi:hypothetical protein